ncbi:MAG: HEAT repeat domain-containing protein [Planctomycetota bacterium]|jgi:hypothetical protein|nr:HEAT repeat domain-containing protein [Planctomycetota bacterium]
MNYEEFCAAGYRIDSFLSCPIWYVRNIGIKLIGTLSLKEYEGCLKTKCLDLKEAPIIRRNALRSLRRPAFQLDTDFLIGCLDDPYWEARAVALQALSEISEPSHDLTAKLIESLLNAKTGSLREQNFEVLMHCVAALGTIGTPPRTLEGLSVLALHPNWLIRAQSAIALNHLSHRYSELADESRAILEAIEPQSHGMQPVFPLKKILAQAAQSAEHSSSPALSFIDPARGWQL